MYFKINLKYFYISCAFASLFVSLDVIYQFFNGRDIFGFESLADGRKLSGPFGDEYIAGGYLQRFSLFAFFLIPLFYSRYNSVSKIVVPLLVMVFLAKINFNHWLLELLVYFVLGIIWVFPSMYILKPFKKK